MSLEPELLKAALNFNHEKRISSMDWQATSRGKVASTEPKSMTTLWQRHSKLMNLASLFENIEGFMQILLSLGYRIDQEGRLLRVLWEKQFTQGTAQPVKVDNVIQHFYDKQMQPRNRTRIYNCFKSFRNNGLVVVKKQKCGQRGSPSKLYSINESKFGGDVCKDVFTSLSMFDEDYFLKKHKLRINVLSKFVLTLTITEF